VQLVDPNEVNELDRAAAANRVVLEHLSVVDLRRSARRRIGPVVLC
jgi:hypothetical protein